MRIYYAIMINGLEAWVIKVKAKDWIGACMKVDKIYHTGLIVIDATEFHNLRKVKPILDEKVEI